MSKSKNLDINKLSLDLNNFRTIPQKNEEDAINAMISIKPDRFYAVMDSIIDDGYLLTENIIVLKNNSSFIVKEGNRRIATLKLIHGQLNIDDFAIPDSIKRKIKSLDSTWLKNNKEVPCAVFDSVDKGKVDRIINLAHGKGEKASRDPWTSVARARHNRDIKKAPEPALDILEKYLQVGKNLTGQQKERWGGDFPLTVLDEALRKIAMRFNLKNTVELSKKYPRIKMRNELEDIIRDIGLEQLNFRIIRDKKIDFGIPYGIPPIVVQPPVAENQGNSNSNNQTSNTTPQSNSGTTNTSPTSSQNNTSTTPTTASNPTKPPKAYPTNDPKHVATLLRKFNPKGNNRQKVVTLRDEIKKLNIKNNPIAFCFLLRSMFEISAKVYCKDNSINLQKRNGQDKSLVEILRSVTNHLTNNNANKPMVKVLHGAMTEIGRPDGILSVTSMNQLVHNPTFSVLPSDISTLFGNIYPLLESMN